MTSSASIGIDPREKLDAQDYGPIFSGFLRNAEIAPDATAIVSELGSVSYRQLAELTAGIAGNLRASGISPGDRVAVVSGREQALVFGILGASRSGATFSAIDLRYPPDRIATLIEKLDPRTIILCGTARTLLDATLADRFPDCRLLHVPSDLSQAQAAFAGTAPLESSETSESDLAYITFTSGTTGMPKAVATRHSPLGHFIDWHRRRHLLGSDDRFSMLSGIGHDPVYRDIFTPLSIGASLHIPSPETLMDPLAAVTWMAENRITIVHLTPAHGEIIAEGASTLDLTLPHLRGFFWGGDRLSRHLLEQIRAIAPHARQVNFYGTTETPQAMAYFEADGPIEDPIPIGRGVESAQILVIDAHGNLADTGKQGEIWVRSPYLSSGYMLDSDETSARFKPNPFTNDPMDTCYRTGDRGFYNENGDVVYIGREDGQVKIRGFRVEPTEVARAIERVPMVRRSLVISQTDGRGRTRLVAYYTSENADDQVRPADVTAALIKALPDYMVPEAFVPMVSFPLTANGKIDVACLPAPSEAQAGSDDDYVAPANEEEGNLARIWMDILGMERVSVTDSFTRLGGDSLSAIRAIVRMRAQGVPQDVARSILQGKSIRQICAEASGDVSPQLDAVRAEESRSNLQLNLLRGLLVILNVTNHWMPALLKRLPQIPEIVSLMLAPFFNLATPGFAIVFGATLGKVYYPKFRNRHARAANQMLSGALFLAFGNLLVLLLTCIELGLPSDLHQLLGWFYSPLLFYILAMATYPLLFSLLARSRHETLLILIFAVASFAAYHLCQQFVDPELSDAGHYLLLLVTVSHFNYFNLSFGALCGMAAALYHDRVGPDAVMKRGFLFGPLLVLLGCALAYNQFGSLAPLVGDGADMGLWRWSVSGGMFIILASLIGLFVRTLADPVRDTPEAARLVGLIGQCAFIIFVLHMAILKLKNILDLIGISDIVGLLAVFLVFGIIMATVIGKMYSLYYGPIRPIAARLGMGKPKNEALSQ